MNAIGRTNPQFADIQKYFVVNQNIRTDNINLPV